MSTNRERFHVYFNRDERALLESLAEREGATRSSLVRVAVRKMFGLPVPAGWLSSSDAALELAAELTAAKAADAALN